MVESTEKIKHVLIQNMLSKPAVFFSFFLFLSKNILNALFK